jgi:hypothetical protein
MHFTFGWIIGTIESDKYCGIHLVFRILSTDVECSYGSPHNSLIH